MEIPEDIGKDYLMPYCYMLIEFFKSIPSCWKINREVNFLAATKAVKVGVDGIIVSNHGARQLDYSPATISVLEEVQTETFPSVLLI